MSRPTLVALAIVVDGDRCLVQSRRSADCLNGLWEFPGGKVRAGEAPSVAAVRECAEETGVAVEPVAALACQSATYPNGDVEIHPIVCRLRGCGPSGGVWVGLDELARLPMPAVNAAIIASLRDHLQT